MLGGMTWGVIAADAVLHELRRVVLLPAVVERGEQEAHDEVDTDHDGMQTVSNFRRSFSLCFH